MYTHVCPFESSSVCTLKYLMTLDYILEVHLTLQKWTIQVEVSRYRRSYLLLQGRFRSLEIICLLLLLLGWRQERIKVISQVTFVKNLLLTK